MFSSLSLTEQQINQTSREELPSLVCNPEIKLLPFIRQQWQSGSSNNVVDISIYKATIKFYSLNKKLILTYTYTSQRSPCLFKRSSYWVFSHGATVAMLVSLNKGTAAFLVSPTNPPGIELCSYAKVKPFVLVQKHDHWSCEWKHSILSLLVSYYSNNDIQAPLCRPFFFTTDHFQAGIVVRISIRETMRCLHMEQILFCLCRGTH